MLVVLVARHVDVWDVLAVRPGEVAVRVQVTVCHEFCRVGHVQAKYGTVCWSSDIES